MAAIWPDYDNYQRATDREIPVVTLSIRYPSPGVFHGGRTLLRACRWCRALHVLIGALSIERHTPRTPLGPGQRTRRNRRAGARSRRVLPRRCHALLMVRGPAAAAISPDGEYVAYRDSVTGKPQLWSCPRRAVCRVSSPSAVGSLSTGIRRGPASSMRPIATATSASPIR